MEKSERKKRNKEIEKREKWRQKKEEMQPNCLFYFFLKNIISSPLHDVQPMYTRPTLIVG